MAHNRKPLAWLMAAALGATLFACGSPASTEGTTAPADATTAPAATSQPAADTPAPTDGGSDAAYADYSKGFPTQVTIQIPVYDRAFEGWNVTDNYYTRWIQQNFGDKYNVKVQYVSIGRTTEVQDFMSMLAAGSAPNIIFHYDMPQAVNYYNEGAMQKLDLDEIAHYAPNYWSQMGQVIKDYGEMDGANYFFFAERQAIYYNWVTLIRQDWVDKVGAQLPKTREELEAVALKWKEAGLGTIGDGLKNKSFTYDYGYRGTSVDPRELALYSDLNIAPLTWNSSKEYLKKMNYEFNAGIVDPEFYLRADDAALKAEFVSGKTGTYGFYISSSTDVISSLVANDPNAKVAVLHPRAHVPAGNNPYYYKYPPYGMIMGINSTSTPEQRAAIWMFLEWMNTPENLFYLQNGVEGQNYTLDADGVAIPVADFSGESKRSNNNNKDYWCLVAEVAHYSTEELSFKANRVNLAPAGYESLVDDAYAYDKEVAEFGLINTIFTKTVATAAEYAPDLNALWQELYVKCVTGKEADFEKNYEDACKQYLDAGYQKVLDEKAQLYDAGSYK